MMRLTVTLIGLLFCGMSLASAGSFNQQAIAQGSNSTQSQSQSQKQKNSDDELLMTALRSGKMSDSQEDELGRRIAGSLLGASPLVNDDKLQNYVNLVGRWVALQSKRPNLSWHFGVIDSDDVNAFSAPGGYIFVTRGLYRELSDEAELAAVLGHEIGHVQQRHHLKLLQKSAQVAVLGKALQSALAKESGKDGTAAAFQNLIGNGAEVVARSLDKNSEYEADRIGMVLTARAGYDPYGLPMVLEKIGHAGQVNRNSTSLLYKTHPLPDDRLDHLAESAGDRMDPYADGKTLASRFVKLP